MIPSTKFDEKLSVLKKYTEALGKIIKTYERDKIYKSMLKEIPEQILDLFCVKGQAKFKTIYLENRCNNVDVEKSLDLTVRLVTRSYGDKIKLLKGIEKNFLSIKKSMANG